MSAPEKPAQPGHPRIVVRAPTGARLLFAFVNHCANLVDAVGLAEPAYAHLRIDAWPT